MSSCTLECTKPYKPEDMNVFMEPLIYELKNLFEEGIACYDALEKETFKLRVVMLWTIHNWPGKLTFAHVFRRRESAKSVDTKMEHDVRSKNQVFHLSK